MKRRKELHVEQNKQLALLTSERIAAGKEQEGLQIENDQLGAEKQDLTEALGLRATDSELLAQETAIAAAELELRKTKIQSLEDRQEQCDLKCSALASDWQNRCARFVQMQD